MASREPTERRNRYSGVDGDPPLRPLTLDVHFDGAERLRVDDALLDAQLVLNDCQELRLFFGRLFRRLFRHFLNTRVATESA